MSKISCISDEYEVKETWMTSIIKSWIIESVHYRVDPFHFSKWNEMEASIPRRISRRSRTWSKLGLDPDCSPWNELNPGLMTIYSFSFRRNASHLQWGTSRNSTDENYMNIFYPWWDGESRGTGSWLALFGRQTHSAWPANRYGCVESLIVIHDS